MMFSQSRGILVGFQPVGWCLLLWMGFNGRGFLSSAVAEDLVPPLISPKVAARLPKPVAAPIRMEFIPGIRPEIPQDPVDQDAIQLRALGQQQFVQASYELMATTYGVLCALPSATVSDHLWHGHAHQLRRNWPAACRAYQGALAKLDAEITSTEIQIKEFEARAFENANNKLQDARGYRLLKRSQESFPADWPALVLQVGLLELIECKNPEEAARTLAKGLRFTPDLALPLDQLHESVETATAPKGASLSQRYAQGNQLIFPVETLRFQAIAQEQLQQPAAAFDNWSRVRFAQILYQSYLARTNPEHLKELASQLPPDSLKPYHKYVLQKSDQLPIAPREAKDFWRAGGENPFQAVSLPNFDFTMSGPAAANLVKLADGRMIMAYATGDPHQIRIKLSQSKDGIEWETPWEFAHNSIFNTRAPSLVIDDQGEIWMLCLSQRLTTQRFTSAPYHLWLTHSRDGREWSPLRVVQMQDDSPNPEPATSQYQEVPQLMRLPGSRYGIIWRNLFAAAKSPGEISVLNRLPLPPLERNQYVSNTHATFESNGRCHVVFDDFNRGLHYTRSDDLQTWSPLQNLGLAEKNAGISMPQLLLEGDQAALLYERSSGFWLQRGKIVAEGLKLELPIHISDHRMSPNGSRLLLDGDEILIPAGSEPNIPMLFKAKFADLLGTPGSGQNK